jgi:hypothetical protein
MKKRWDGLMVCEEDYELRHPQDFLRVRGDNPAVPWARPVPEEVFVGPACFIWDESAYAGLGSAGCMRAAYTPLPYTELLAMKYPLVPANPYPAQSGIPGYAIPGLAIPGVTYTGLTF